MDIERLFNEEVMSLDTYIMFKLKEQTAKLKDELTARNRAPISLSMGAPTANPPKALINRLKEILDEDGIHMYSTPKGEPYLRKAIATRMKNRFGVELDPETEIFSLVGSKEGIANLVRFITTPKHEEFEKDVIMVPDPCYASYLQFVKCSGAKAYPMPLTKENDFKPDVEAIYNQIIKDGYKAENIKALFINFPNNPMGISTTKEYVQSVINFCKKHDILLASDAAYADIYFAEDEKPFSIFELEGAKMSYEIIIGADGSGDHPSFAILTDAKAALESIGFTLEINDVTDSNIMWDALNAGTAEMWAAAWQATIDPDMYQTYHSESVKSNYYHINDATLDQDIIDARSSADQEYRKSVYKQCLDIILDWAVEIPVYQRQNCIIYSPERVNADTFTKDVSTFYYWYKDIENIEMN